MNEQKRMIIDETLNLSKSLYQSVSCLDDFESNIVKKYLPKAQFYCKLICEKINYVLSLENRSHKNVPGNLYIAENTDNMRYAISYLHSALAGYTKVQKILEQLGDLEWIDRFEEVISCQVEIEYAEDYLKSSK